MDNKSILNTYHSFYKQYLMQRLVNDPNKNRSTEDPKEKQERDQYNKI